MKTRLFSGWKSLALFTALALVSMTGGSSVIAQDAAPPVETAASVPAADPASDPAAELAAAGAVPTAAATEVAVATVVPEPAAAPTPTADKGDTAWILICSALVIFMTLPGLALFYGGLVRSKNVLSILMQTLVVFALVAVLWALYGYSLAFTEGNAFIGGFDRLWAQGINGTLAATFTKGVYIPELAFFVFQGAFACITCALIIGSFAERVKFAGVLLFTVIWFTFAYLPMAHMGWFFPGPDAFTDAAAVDGVLAKSGWLWAKGALDFAGGTVVHINAAVAGLVGAYMIGNRVGYRKEAPKPHNLTQTAGVVGLGGRTGLKNLLKADDSLDVFGVHGIGGITGALLTGVFAAPSLGGAGIWDYVTETALADYSIAAQVWIQAQGVLTTIVVSGVVSLLAFTVVKYTVGLRVSEEAERNGLDISSHGETAYEL